MLKQLWKEVPAGFKVFWFAGAVLGLSFSALIIAVLIKLFMKL